MSQARVSITPADAWSDQRLTPLQCRLLGLIGSYLGKDHRAWPSQNTLADQLGVTRKAVNDGVKALREYGYIQVQKRLREDGGQTSNCYFVVMDPVGREGDTPCEDEVTPLSPLGDTPCNLQRVTPPVTSKGDTKKDPIERPKEECDFEDAWKAYQSCKLKAGQTRKDAKAQWPKAVKRAGSPERILKAIQIAVAEKNAAEGFAPNLPDMFRWLQKDRWQDVEREVAEPVAADVDIEAWREAMRKFVDHGTWPAFLGPKPGEADCRVPEGLLNHWKRIAA